MCKKMNKYEVLCCGGTYIIIAEDWRVGCEGLKFIINNEVVAWFTSFDYWIYTGKINEAESPRDT